MAVRLGPIDAILPVLWESDPYEVIERFPQLRSRQMIKIDDWRVDEVADQIVELIENRYSTLA